MQRKRALCCCMFAVVLRLVPWIYPTPCCALRLGYCELHPLFL